MFPINFFLGILLTTQFLFLTQVSMQIDVEDGASPDEPEAASAYIWKYFSITTVDAKKSGVKHATCNFCEKNFSSCSTTRVSAHILGRAVLGQRSAGINPYIPIKRTMMIGVQISELHKRMLLKKFCSKSQKRMARNGNKH